MYFNDIFEPYTNWQDDPGIDVAALLKQQFPLFYTGGQLNYDMLKQGVINYNKKAQDLFKQLFRIPFRLRPNAQSALLSCGVLERIKSEYGAKILAHGVEEAKGGIQNLLMMCISNCIHVSSQYWGNFVDGAPNISPIMHGPYYVIYTTGNDVSKSKTPKSPTIDNIEYILVPFQEHIPTIVQHLGTLIALNMISEKQADNFKSKLVSYDNFLTLLSEPKKRKRINLFCDEKLPSVWSRPVTKKICLFSDEHLIPAWPEFIPEKTIDNKF